MKRKRTIILSSKRSSSSSVASLFPAFSLESTNLAVTKEQYLLIKLLPWKTAQQNNYYK
jgi:hypothetical protein